MYCVWVVFFLFEKQNFWMNRNNYKMWKILLIGWIVCNRFLCLALLFSEYFKRSRNLRWEKGIEEMPILWQSLHVYFESIIIMKIDAVLYEYVKFIHVIYMDFFCFQASTALCIFMSTYANSFPIYIFLINFYWARGSEWALGIIKMSPIEGYVSSFRIKIEKNPWK